MRVTIASVTIQLISAKTNPAPANGSARAT
jgi:hypothetical protein